MPTLPRPAVHRLVAAAAGMALITAGCGGAGGGAASGTIVAPVTTRPVNTSPPPPGQQQLQSIVVQPGDLPAGWTPKPASPAADQAAAATAFAQCLGAPNTSGDVVSIAYSPDFVNGSAFVAATATSYKSPADVQADIAAYTNPKASGCFAQVGKARLAAALPKDATVRTVTLKVTPGAGGGPANVVATATATVVFTVGGHQLTFHDDTVILTAPRIEAHIDFYSLGKPIAAQVKAAVVNRVSVRVTNGS